MAQVTTHRFVYGTVSPSMRLLFEFPIERMARVELAPPHTRLILWTWHKMPKWVAPFLLAPKGSRPNHILERVIEGARPAQLLRAFADLLALTQQRKAGGRALLASRHAGHAADGGAGGAGGASGPGFGTPPLGASLSIGSAFEDVPAVLRGGSAAAAEHIILPPGLQRSASGEPSSSWRSAAF